MRVTNNMIMDNAQRNINGTKELVDKRNTQMTTQKKINKPSDDPVIAIRSLRLSTTLSKVDQYYEKNIPDAESWLDVTETALLNIKNLITDSRTLAVKGSTDTLTADDRKTILTQLSSLQEQLYMEGNSDYANRTVFTGFRTDKNLVFTENEKETKYSITETIASTSVEEYRFYNGEVTIPTDSNTATSQAYIDSNMQDIEKTTYYRARVSYDAGEVENGLKFTKAGFSYEWNGVTINLSCDISAGASTWTGGAVDKDGNAVAIPGDAPFTPAMGGKNITTYVYKDEKEWADDKGGKNLDPYEIAFIESTGEIIFGSAITTQIMGTEANITADYDKTGFTKGELRPEYYFNCVQTVDADGVAVDKEKGTFTKYTEDGERLRYDIKYIVSADQLLTVNTEAIEVFNQDIQRDMGEMINVVQRAMEAHDKVDKLKAMKAEEQYADDDTQAALEKWLAAAQKEADYADDDLQKLYSTELGKMDKYLAKINLGITNLGCTVDQLKLTKTRMCDQQETVEALQSQNEDKDLSEIIIEYTAAYTAYQASLTAASKLGGMTLLNYL